MRVDFSYKDITLGTVARITGGRIVTKGIPDAENEIISSICTDSREADSRTVFAAIAGERVDGHNFIPKLSSEGCPFSIAEKIPDMSSCESYAAVIVESVLAALSRLGGALKGRADIFTVGVTGSVGKTTTKEFAAAVLSEKYKTFRTEGNFNSVIGMPMSIMGMPCDSEAAVLEMGMSGLGEISSMTRAAKPNVAVITTVGTAHLELLGTRENICRAKMEIAEGLCEDGLLVLCGDEPLLRGAGEALKGSGEFISLSEAEFGKSTALDGASDKKAFVGKRVIYVGIENRECELSAESIRLTPEKTVFDLKMQGRLYRDIELPIVGKHYVYGALFAIAVGMEAEMDIEDIRRGLLNYKSVGLRQNVLDIGGIKVIEDCYNASPESMRAALDVLKAMSSSTGGRSAALLGDMLELGEASSSLHREVGEYSAKAGTELLFTFGERASDIARGAAEQGMKSENIYINLDKESPEESGKQLAEVLRAGDVLLVKASRSMAAERIVHYLEDKFS